MPPRADVEEDPNFTKSIRKVVRCTGHTLKGAQCKRRTGKTQYCYSHLEKIEHVKIKKSTIPAAGYGLFTTVRRPARRKVVEYRGNKVSRPRNTLAGDYVLETTGAHPPPYTYIDANHTTAGSGRFSNMAKASNHLSNNAKLSLDYRGHKANIVSTRAIPAGREILTSYGRGYWNHKRMHEEVDE